MQGVGTPGAKRFNLTLLETEVTCQYNCIKEIEWDITELPLISTNPECPIIDFKVMQDDGNGNPTHVPNPLEIKMENLAAIGKFRMEIDTAEVTKLLQSGEKLNYVLIAVTKSGMHKQIG